MPARAPNGLLPPFAVAPCSTTSAIERAVSETETERQKAAANDQDAEQAPVSANPAADEAAEQGQGVSDAEDEPANRRARRAAAARARKERIKERQDAQSLGLGAQEIIDDAVVRSTDSAAKWLKRNGNVLQWLFVGGITCWAAWGIYTWRKAHTEATSSDKVAKAAAAQFGKVGEDADRDEDGRVVDPTPVFADDATRLDAARTAYEAALKGASNDGTGLYARLALANVLIEQGKADEAKAELDRVLAAKFTQKDAALKARAQEGLAQVAEAKGDKAGALALYEQIAATNLKGVTELGQYNQARVLYELNRVDEAKKVVEALYEKYPPREGLAGMFPGYIEQGVKTLANVLGVEPPKPKTAAITPEQVNSLAAEVQRQINDKSKSSGETN